MAIKTLILYSTVDGHTTHICEKLKALLSQQDHEVEMVEISDNGSISLDEFEKVIIGASIRYGNHRPAVIDFINENTDKLVKMKTAFFSVNVVARKKEKNQPDTNPYVVKFFKKTSWMPTLVEVFGGRLDYQSYSFFDRQMIRLIMLITGGPTAPDTKVEYTDWDKVDDFGRRLAEM